MPYGLIIVLNFEGKNESKNRNFRKKREQIMERTNMQCLKNGVYLFPFRNPEPSNEEIAQLERFLEIIHDYKIKADYYCATQVGFKTVIEAPPKIVQNSKLIDLSSIKVYFVLEPIKVERKDPAEDQ